MLAVTASVRLGPGPARD